MDNIFFVAGFISVIFFIAKFLEMRYIDKETKPLKFIIRDTLVVFVCVVAGNFVIEQVSPVVNEIVPDTTPMAFTDNAPF
jgi:hypothetical protein